MTVAAACAAGSRDRRAALLGVGFLAAVGLRLLIGGPGVSKSPQAGLAFAGCLLALTLAARVRVPLSARAVVTGLLGATLLCLPVLLARGDQPLHDGTGLASWALVVTVVAVSEELFLRGALYDAVAQARGPGTAVAVAAAAFAALHVPLYGWYVLPLDLYVGVVLGELRRRTGTPATPAVTHACTDLATWFLR